LPEMQQSSGSELVLDALQQLGRHAPLGWPNGRCVPLLGVHVIDGNERRLTAHREPHVARSQIFIDLIAERRDLSPLLLRVWLRYARFLANSCHAHRVLKLHFAWI